MSGQTKSEHRFEKLARGVAEVEKFWEPYVSWREEKRMREQFEVIEEAVGAGANETQLAALSKALVRNDLGVAADLMVEIKNAQVAQVVAAAAAAQPVVVERVDPAAGMSLTEIVRSPLFDEGTKRRHLDLAWGRINDQTQAAIRTRDTGYSDEQRPAAIEEARQALENATIVCRNARLGWGQKKVSDADFTAARNALARAHDLYQRVGGR